MSNENSEVRFPCPACGFLVFGGGPGTYEICAICDWEDDPVQLKFPTMPGGANSSSLAEHQECWLKAIPSNITEREGFRRDPAWRPLAADDLETDDSAPRTGKQYFDAFPLDKVQYYWER